MSFVERTAYYADAPIALIVGCGDLGMGSARALGQRHPLLVIDISPERLDRAIETLRHDGYTVTGHVCDITDPAQTKALGQLLSKGPGIRALAHVAAVGPAVGDWRKMMAVDLIGALLVAEAAGPYMVRGGAAIFVGSLASYLCPVDPKLDALLHDALKPDFYDAIVKYHGGIPTMMETYSYAKLGVNLLVEKLAVAWGEKEVRALSLSPGMIDTTIGRNEGATLPAHDGTKREVPRNDKVREIPLGRQGKPLEITSVVSFLLSDEASFVNGIDIVVDGGHRARWRAQGVIKR